MEPTMTPTPELTSSPTASPLKLRWLGTSVRGSVQLEEGTHSSFEVVAQADADVGPVVCESADDALRLNCTAQPSHIVYGRWAVNSRAPVSCTLPSDRRLVLHAQVVSTKMPSDERSTMLTCRLGSGPKVSMKLKILRQASAPSSHPFGGQYNVLFDRHSQFSIKSALRAMCRLDALTAAPRR